MALPDGGRMNNKPEFTFPVVDGMVAVEHVRYLAQDRAKLIEALQNLLAKDTFKPVCIRDASALLRELQ